MKLSTEHEHLFLPQRQRRDLDARMEYLKNGPFNVVFHNMQPDWIEEEMADDIGEFSYSLKNLLSILSQ